MASHPHSEKQARPNTPGHRPSRWLTTFVPILIVVAWFVAAGIGGPYFLSLIHISEPTRH